MPSIRWAISLVERLLKKKYANDGVISASKMKEGDTVKNCYYCNGKKVRYLRDLELKITIRCEKCGAEIATPYMTEDSARGYWNMKQAALERANKHKKEAAAS